MIYFSKERHASSSNNGKLESVSYQSPLEDTMKHLNREVVLFDNNSYPIQNPQNQEFVLSSRLTQTSVAGQMKDLIDYRYNIAFIAPFDGWVSVNINMHGASPSYWLTEYKISFWTASIIANNTTYANCYENSDTFSDMSHRVSHNIINTNGFFVKKDSPIIYMFRYDGFAEDGFEVDNYLWTGKEIIEGIHDPNGNVIRNRFGITIRG